MRRKEIFKCFRQAVRRSRIQGISIQHFAILSNHVHLIVEPRAESLAREIQSLAISFAKRLNRVMKRRGAVFLQRYHQHILKTPREVRNALAYVLTNQHQHEARKNRGTTKENQPVIQTDPYSSALRFAEWKALLGERPRLEPSLWSEQSIENWLDEILSPTRTWLLKSGWLAACLV